VVWLIGQEVFNMSAKSLMNQAVSIQPFTGYAANGKEQVGGAVSERWRVQPTTKNIFSPRGAVDRGELVTINAVGYAPAITVATIDSKVTVGGQVYKVYATYPVPGGNGQTDHVKVQLVLWRA
jgi:hypothetical protein